MELAAALFLAVLPAILLIQYFVMRDAYPEPPGLVWKTVAIGAVSTIPIAALGLGIEALIEPVLGSGFLHVFVNAFVFAAVFEECGKFLVLLWIAKRNRDFDEPMDGIVYGVAASLGFAGLENLLYVGDGGMSVAILRMVTAVPGHAMFGVLMGMYFGIAHFAPAQERAKWMRRALLTPIFYHGWYDFALMMVEHVEGFTAFVCMSAALFVLAFGVIQAWRLHKRMWLFQRSGVASHLASHAAEPFSLKRLFGFSITISGGLTILVSGAFIVWALQDRWSEGSALDDGAVFGIILAFFAISMLLGVWVFRIGIRKQNADEVPMRLQAHVHGEAPKAVFNEERSA